MELFRRPTTDTPGSLRKRDGHERAVPAAAELRELRERAGLSVRALARELTPELDDMTEGAVRAALTKLESGATDTVRRDLYELALGAVQAAITARYGSLRERDGALAVIALATPDLANAEADLEWIADGIRQHEAAIKMLEWIRPDYQAQADRPARAIAKARAKLGA
jgi:hypothetical protein